MSSERLSRGAGRGSGRTVDDRDLTQLAMPAYAVQHQCTVAVVTSKQAAGECQRQRLGERQLRTHREYGESQLLRLSPYDCFGSSITRSRCSEHERRHPGNQACIAIGIDGADQLRRAVKLQRVQDAIEQAGPRSAPIRRARRRLQTRAAACRPARPIA